MYFGIGASREFHVLDLQKTAKKCAKICNTRVQIVLLIKPFVCRRSR